MGSGNQRQARRRSHTRLLLSRRPVGGAPPHFLSSLSHRHAHHTISAPLPPTLLSSLLLSPRVRAAWKAPLDRRTSSPHRCVHGCQARTQRQWSSLMARAWGRGKTSPSPSPSFSLSPSPSPSPSPSFPLSFSPSLSLTQFSSPAHNQLMPCSASTPQTINKPQHVGPTYVPDAKTRIQNQMRSACAIHRRGRGLQQNAGGDG